FKAPVVCHSHLVTCHNSSFRLMLKRFQRSPTPPPFLQIADRDETDPLRLAWFWDSDAGGMILDFGKLRGQAMHDVSLNYLIWVRHNCEYKVCYLTFPRRTSRCLVPGEIL